MPIVLAGLLLAFLVMLLFGGTELDRGLLMLVYLNAEPRLAVAAELVRVATSPMLLAATGAAGAGWLLVRRHWQNALLLLAITAGGLLLAAYLGSLTAPLRPPPSERILPTQRSPFPNPAAAGGVFVWLSVAFLLARRRPWRTLAVSLIVMLALAVGIFQLAAGAAWPSDVIGGWALGLCWTLLLLWLAGEDLGEGTPRALRHSFREGERHGEPTHRDGPRD